MFVSERRGFVVFFYFSRFQFEQGLRSGCDSILFFSYVPYSIDFEFLCEVWNRENRSQRQCTMTEYLLGRNCSYIRGDFVYLIGIYFFTLCMGVCEDEKVYKRPHNFIRGVFESLSFGTEQSGVLLVDYYTPHLS